MCMLTHPRHQGTQKDVLAQVVEHHDVGVHVEEVIAVGRVVLWRPALRLGAAEGEHVVAVFGLIVHTVEARQLQWDGLTDQQITFKHEAMGNEFTVCSSYGNGHKGAGLV